MEGTLCMALRAGLRQMSRALEEPDVPKARDRGRAGGQEASLE